MSESKDEIEFMKLQKELRDIAETVRISESSRSTALSYIDKTLPVIQWRDFGQEIKILSYPHWSY